MEYIKRIKTDSRTLDLIVLYLRNIEPRPNHKNDKWYDINIGDEIILYDDEIVTTVRITNIFESNDIVSLYLSHSKNINPFYEKPISFVKYILHYTNHSQLNNFSLKCFEMSVLDVKII